MNVFQKIINMITFGLYNPEKKFEQEVLGEVTTNLEEIENLRNDVEKAVSEYDKYFPNESNIFNNYELYNFISDIDIDKENGVVSKNYTAEKLVRLEEQLQEQGKYVGMDEKTRIKAVLAEKESTYDTEWLKDSVKNNGESIDSEVAEAYKISSYQKYMNSDHGKENFKGILDNSKSTKDGIVNGILYSPKILSSVIKGTINYEFIEGGLDNMLDKNSAEAYISLIMANEKATRQSDGTYLTKTSEEWKEIDAQMEEELRSMPQKSLIAKGEVLEKELQERYSELIGDREEMQQSTDVDWSKAEQIKAKESEGSER